jgi:hypothetical protein
LHGPAARHNMGASRRSSGADRIGFFYAGDGGEPTHVHAERDECEAKFWLVHVRLAWSSGFVRKEINRLRLVVEENQQHFLESWNGFFSD